MAAACYTIYMLWFHQLVMRTSAELQTTAVESEKGRAAAMADEVIRERISYLESIAEEADEYLWTTEETEYRKGPGIYHSAEGTLSQDSLVKRTGITHSGWSRVLIDDNIYYMESDDLTDVTPVSALISAGQKGEYQKYALSLFPDFGWSESELEPLINLWNRESGWNPSAHNRSGAHGIPQALPAGKMASEGADYYTNAEPQIRWGLKYIRSRYGSPSAAWANFRSRGWY